MMSKHLSINLPEVIYKQLEHIANQHHCRIENELKAAIKMYLESNQVQDNGSEVDSFFQIGGSGESGLQDLAKSHDKHLYE